MNKPITNRVKSAPNSPAKQATKAAGNIAIVNDQSTDGTPDQQVDETVRTKRNLYSSDQAAWDANNDNVQSKYKDYNEFHAAAEAWRGNNPGYQYKEETVTKTIPGTPGETKRTEYTPQYTRTQTQTTPWENRWADRIADQQVREGRQDARRELRKIGVEEFKTLRREGAGLRDAFKGMRDVQTGRGNLSDYERDLYETKRGLKGVEEAQAAENAYRRLATRGENVETVEDFTLDKAGTTTGGTQLENYEKNLGGKSEFKAGDAAEPQNWHSGIDARKKSRETANFAADAMAASQGAGAMGGASADAPANDKKKGGKGSDLTPIPPKADTPKTTKPETTEAAETPKERKTWRDRLQTTVDNAKQAREGRQMNRENAERAVLDGNEAAITPGAERRVEKRGRKALKEFEKDNKKIEKSARKLEKNKDYNNAISEIDALNQAEEDATLQNDPLFQGQDMTGKQMERKVKKDRKQRGKYERKTARQQKRGKLPEGESLVSPRDQANRAAYEEARDAATPAKMTFGRNVGMQSKSALKKGYFKNK
jgi:hypothetical protein